MEPGGSKEVVLPHHEQQPLCTTRLPYRQGRKLTAVKVYTIFDESNHLLIFGVPALNLRQETKALFSKFGRLSQFIISMEHPAEAFSETYHATFERIQSARLAKRMLDTKNFYGGSLHVCYAPEFETVEETRNKLLQRQRDVLYRLRNLQKEPKVEEKPAANAIEEVTIEHEKEKMYMGQVNIIGTGNNINKMKKRKLNQNIVIEKKFKPTINNEIDDSNTDSNIDSNTCDSSKVDIRKRDSKEQVAKNKSDIIKEDINVEVIDFTSTEHETITNINDSLNYNKFGNEVIRKVPEKPLNKIVFHIGNKI